VRNGPGHQHDWSEVWKGIGLRAGHTDADVVTSVVAEDDRSTVTLPVSSPVAKPVTNVVPSFVETSVS